MLNVCVPTANHTCQLLLNIWLVHSSPGTACQVLTSLILHKPMALANWQVLEHWWKLLIQGTVQSEDSCSSVWCFCSVQRQQWRVHRRVNLLFWQINTQQCKCIVFEKANKTSCGSFSKQVWCSSLFSKMPVVLQLDCQMDWKWRKNGKN